MGKEIQKVNAERKRQRYGKEFKLAAVKLLQSGTKPGTLIAMELGIQRNLLYKWAETLARHGGNIETRSRQRTGDSNANWHVLPKSVTS
jgi:transposase-like protein